MTVILVKVVRRLGYIVATLIIMAALVVSLGSLLTPYLNDHLPDFEAWSSQLLEAPTKIKHVQLSWAVYEPEIVFDNVTVFDPKTKKPQFVIGRIKVNLNIPRSLAAWRLVMQSIRITGIHLTVRQPSSDKIFIEELKNLAITDNSTGSATHFDEIIKWIFSQPNLIVENVDIDYYLPSKNKKSILIHTLALKNNAARHELSGLAILNQPIPTKVRMRLEWKGSVLNLSDISATGYVYLEGVSLPQWLNQFTWHNL